MQGLMPLLLSLCVAAVAYNNTAFCQAPPLSQPREADLLHEAIRSSKRPKFNELWRNYPTGDLAEFKRLAGGEVDADWVTNTCAIRMSYALTKSGHVIPKLDRSQTMQMYNKAFGLSGDVTIKGEDGEYLYRVQPLGMYLSVIYSITLPTASNNTTNLLEYRFSSGEVRHVPPHFVGHRGIITFSGGFPPGVSGHVDLWDGTTCAGQCYFDIADHVSLLLIDGPVVPPWRLWHIGRPRD